MDEIDDFLDSLGPTEEVAASAHDQIANLDDELEALFEDLGELTGTPVKDGADQGAMPVEASLELGAGKSKSGAEEDDLDEDSEDDEEQNFILNLSELGSPSKTVGTTPEDAAEEGQTGGDGGSSGSEPAPVSAAGIYEDKIKSNNTTQRRGSELKEVGKLDVDEVYNPHSEANKRTPTRVKDEFTSEVNKLDVEEVYPHHNPKRNSISGSGSQTQAADEDFLSWLENANAGTSTSTDPSSSTNISSGSAVNANQVDQAGSTNMNINMPIPPSISTTADTPNRAPSPMTKDSPRAHALDFLKNMAQQQDPIPGQEKGAMDGEKGKAAMAKKAAAAGLSDGPSGGDKRENRGEGEVGEKEEERTDRGRQSPVAAMENMDSFFQEVFGPEFNSAGGGKRDITDNVLNASNASGGSTSTTGDSSSSSSGGINISQSGLEVSSVRLRLQSEIEEELAEMVASPFPSLMQIRSLISGGVYGGLKHVPAHLRGSVYLLLLTGSRQEDQEVAFFSPTANMVTSAQSKQLDSECDGFERRYKKERGVQNEGKSEEEEKGTKGTKNDIRKLLLLASVRRRQGGGNNAVDGDNVIREDDLCPTVFGHMLAPMLFDLRRGPITVPADKADKDKQGNRENGASKRSESEGCASNSSISSNSDTSCLWEPAVASLCLQVLLGNARTTNEGGELSISSSSASVFPSVFPLVDLPVKLYRTICSDDNFPVSASGPLLRASRTVSGSAMEILSGWLRLLLSYHSPRLVQHLDRIVPGWEHPAEEVGVIGAMKEVCDPEVSTSPSRGSGSGGGLIPLHFLLGVFSPSIPYELALAVLDWQILEGEEFAGLFLIAALLDLMGPFLANMTATEVRNWMQVRKTLATFNL